MARKKKIELSGGMTATEVIAGAVAAANEPPTTATPAAPATPKKTPVDLAMERIEKAIQRARQVKDFAEEFGFLDELTKTVLDVKEWENLPVAVAKGAISDKEIPGAIIMINETILGVERIITEVYVAALSRPRKQLDDGVRLIEGDWKGPKANVDLTAAYELLRRSAKAIETKRLPKGIGREVADEADRLWEIIASYCRNCGTALPDSYVEKGWKSCKACNDAFLKKEKEKAQQAEAARIATVQSLKDRIRAAAKP